MLIVTPSGLWNGHVLHMQAAPKRMLRRITLFPRGKIGARLWMRLIFEVQILRYLLPLAPFIAAMFIWPDLALPISQAPIPMMIVIAIFETKLLSVKRENREKVISDEDMARGQDALNFNATAILRKIAARRDLHDEEIMLVVEQSILARVPPLTLVSVQEAAPKARVLDLDDIEQEMLRQELFHNDLSEEIVHKITLRQNETLRAVTFEASTLSAHARMAARLQKAGDATTLEAT
ncbi:MAG: hypothetical protein AB8B58_12910 [Roseobacter sp.]